MWPYLWHLKHCFRRQALSIGLLALMLDEARVHENQVVCDLNAGHDVLPTIAGYGAIPSDEKGKMAESASQLKLWLMCNFK